MRKQRRGGFKLNHRRHSGANPYSKMWLPVRVPKLHMNPISPVNGEKPGVEKGAQTGEERPSEPSASGKLLVSVIIPAMNEQKTIRAVIREARRVHPHTEVIVVENGSSDRTAKVAAAAGARVISFPEPLGHDVGRRIGAEAASGQVLLFLDGDIVIPCVRLRPFIQAICAGADIVLNDYHGPVNRTSVHPVVDAKHVLNILSNRVDLGGASMTGIPHAISQRALKKIGLKSLENPPLFQAMSIVSGLRVMTVYGIAVGRMNATRKKQNGKDPLVDVIVQDHLDAIGWITSHLGTRAGFTDLERKRIRDEVKP
ncbi:glycosyltransferase family 2 protein [Paenibacillus kribbensis]|uniref:glycosyltransferase family 2 protein n=1 Tax=Paenibacillus TaxID=44249 RepID=UPI00024EF654|nr:MULTISPECIES: glycosyltransferase family 2 protein [Paenibacillus]EHS56268.1 family 2 glycosyl transferase [Paenibacillus sp. Aloe-11]MEC0237677.1 glycosyltransferase family 2 protein [Paenibacillus kribbensis]